MARQTPLQDRLRNIPELHGEQHVATTPIKYTNPTSAKIPHRAAELAGHRAYFIWSSRNNRKGRHQLTLSQSANASQSVQTPRASLSVRAIVNGVWRMLVKYPTGDISWWVAYLFLWGSIVWAVNALFVFLPLIRPSTEFSTEILYGGGITAFIGATIFLFGSFLLILEAINEDQSGCFGWAVKEKLESHHEAHCLHLSPKSRCHHRFHSHPDALDDMDEAESVNEKQSASEVQDEQQWRWYPTYEELGTHYIRELGFLASLSQLIGSIIFWISGVTALPGIQDHMSDGLTKGVYWTPQVVGGSGFIVSGFFFMIENQSAWYRPNLWAIGWHIGAWNLIGGIGFTLSPIFGYFNNSWTSYQSSCSTFWASFAFLIGSFLQLYESLEKHPVSIAND